MQNLPQAEELSRSFWKTVSLSLQEDGLSLLGLGLSYNLYFFYHDGVDVEKQTQADEHFNT